MSKQHTLFFYKPLLCIFLVYAFFHVCEAKNVPYAEANKLKKVVIDPGHGGKDPGAVGSMSYEKDIVLNVALLLGEKIKSKFPATEVIYTREKDVFIELHKRAEIANSAKADLFISIHANSSTNKSVSGAETYVMGLHTDKKNLEVAQKENSVIALETDYSTKYEGYDPKSEESFIIFSLMQTTYLQQSLEMAAQVQDHFVKTAQRTDKGQKQAGFLVLWKTTMPAILVELGYISNPKEEIFLNSKEGQELLANSLLNAFESYKKTIEASSNTQIELSNDLISDTTKQQEAKLLNDSVYFSVQILSSSKSIEINHPYFDKLNQINGTDNQYNVFELKQNTIFKYITGQYSSYQIALDHLKTIKGLYPNAFIVGVKNGSFVPVDKIMKK